MNTELIPSNEELNVYQVMAKTATQSQLFGKIGGEAGLLTIMLMARELGISPMVALMGGINIIQGKAEVSPRLMNSMIRKAGHKIEIVTSTGEICTIKGTRHDTKEIYTCSYTLDDARRAGLVRSGGGYEKFASDMLFARCLSRIARRLFADVISTAYIEGEISHAGGESETVEQAETAVIEPIVVKSGVITFDGFVEALEVAIAKPFDSEQMMEYLLDLEKERKVSVEKIMAQALRPELVQRFYNGFKTWQDAKADAEEQIKS